MPTAPTPLPTIPPFPALADRATGTYNSKAYGWATGWDEDIAPAIEALAENAYDNAVEGAASAVAATTQAGTATTQASAASASAVAAAASAASATNAANVAGTSTSSVAVATANGQSKSFTYVESSRAISLGMFLVGAVTASPTTNWMLLQVTAWNSGTREVTGTVITYSGSGTFAAWTLSLSSARGAAGADAVISSPSLALSGAAMLTVGQNGYTGDVAAGATITLDTLSTLGDGFSFIFGSVAIGTTPTVTADFGSGSEAKALTTPTMISVKNVAGVYTVRWIPLGNPTGVFGAVGTAQVIAAATSSGDIAICQLSATLAIVLYKNASNYPKAAIVDQTGAKVSGHTPIQIEAATAQTTMQIIKVTATTAVAIWGGGSGARAVHLTVSGTTVTAGTVVAVSGDNSNATAICMLTATKFIASYYNISGDSLHARTLTLSGTTLTANTDYTVASSPGSNLVVRLATMSSTQALATFCGSSHGPVARGCVLTEASNVITFPSHATYCVTGSANTTGQGDIVPLTASRALAVVGMDASSTGFGNALLVDYAGTGTGATITPGRPTMIAPGSRTIGHRLALLSNKTALHLAPQSSSTFSSLFLEALSIEGDGVRQGAAVTIARTDNQFDFCVLSSTTALVAYVDSTNSNYPTVRPVALGSVV